MMDCGIFSICIGIFTRLFQFGLKIQSWQLPFLLMAIDCLSVSFYLFLFAQNVGYCCFVIAPRINRSRRPGHMPWVSSGDMCSTSSEIFGPESPGGRKSI